MAEKPYVLYVDDNFHYMNEEERYKGGEYATLEEAVSKCQRIDDRPFLNRYGRNPQRHARSCSRVARHIDGSCRVDLARGHWSAKAKRPLISSIPIDASTNFTTLSILSPQWDSNAESWEKSARTRVPGRLTRHSPAYYLADERADGELTKTK
jgi:hypothetical protein